MPASHEATAFSPGPGVHRSSYVPFRSRVSVSPTCVEFLQSHLLSLKAGFSGGPSSHRQAEVGVMRHVQVWNIIDKETYQESLMDWMGEGK